MKCLNICRHCRSSFLIPEPTETVSYTHLDVYKRQNKESLLRVSAIMDPKICTQKQIQTFLSFADKILMQEDVGLQIAAVAVKEHYRSDKEDARYIHELKRILGLDPHIPLSKETLSEISLDNLKARTSWTIKAVSYTHLQDKAWLQSLALPTAMPERRLIR